MATGQNPQTRIKGPLATNNTQILGLPRNILTLGKLFIHPQVLSFCARCCAERVIGVRTGVVFKTISVSKQRKRN